MPFSLKSPEWMSWYKKPSYVDFQQFAAALNAKAGTASNPSSPRNSLEQKRPSTDIPKKLSLERILKNKPCSPMSLYDFYMYLKYIEHSSENLEFFIWFKNYEQGRLTAFPELPRALTPLSGSQSSFAKREDDYKSTDHYMSESQDDIRMDDTELYARIAAFVKPGCGPGGACPLDRKGSSLQSFGQTDFHSQENILEKKTSTELNDAKRAELETIKELFLLPNSPKELNIPAHMRKKVLEAIEISTDAENLKPVADHCYLLLKSCSHRNFIRLGVGNGTFETLCMASGLGIVLTITGLLGMLLLAFASPRIHECSRWLGLGIWPMWFIGGGLLLSGLRGSCFFLLLFSVRQPLPWETFDEISGASSTKKPRGPITRFFSKIMIFDRKMKVKDDDLRRLQRKVVIQSLLGGAMFATLMCVIFLVLPIWKPL